MSLTPPPPIPTVPIANTDGMVTPEWWRWFHQFLSYVNNGQQDVISNLVSTTPALLHDPPPNLVQAAFLATLIAPPPTVTFSEIVGKVAAGAMLPLPLNDIYQGNAAGQPAAVTVTAALTASPGVTGTGKVVLDTNSTIGGLTVTGTFTATGLVTNADLANSSMTIAGHSVSLGGTQAIAAADLSNGTTGTGAVALASDPNFVRAIEIISTGANAGVVAIDNAAGGQQSSVTFRDAGTLKWQMGKQTDNSFFLFDAANSTNVLTVSTSDVVTIPKLTVTGTFTATGLVTNADLANSSMTIAGHSVSLGGTQAIAAADLSNGVTGSGAVVLATSPTLTDPIMPLFKASTSTLTKTNDTALADVPGLTSFSLAAGKTYVCRGHIQGAAGAGGINLELDTPDTLTATSSSFVFTGWNGATIVSKSTSTTWGAGYAIGGAYTDIDIEGVIVVNAAGTLRIQAAQFASNAASTTVTVNSDFEIVRVN